MKRIPWHVFPTAFSSHPSASLSQDLSLVKTHSVWLQDLMKLRLLMSHCKNSVRDTAISKRWICADSERSTDHRMWAITEGSAVAMECGGLVFASWVISYANEWEDHSKNWETTHSSVF